MQFACGSKSEILLPAYFGNVLPTHAGKEKMWTKLRGKFQQLQGAAPELLSTIDYFEIFR